MSIFSSIKKVLGFPDEYDEDDEELRDLQSHDEGVDRQSAVGMRIDVKPIRQAARTEDAEPSEQDEPAAETVVAQVTAEAEAAAADPTDAPSIESELPGEIFDSIINLFNSTQPDFVARCLDIESQRKYLLENIDSAIRNRLTEIAAGARRRGEDQWNAIRASKVEELEQLMNDYNALKHQREDFQNEQLSSKRQKRALGERIRDLESKVSEQTAEIEQYQLENRSMASRLRAMSVRAGVSADDPAQALSEENVALQDRIAQLEKQLEESATQIANLNTRLEERPESPELSPEQQQALAEIEQRMQQFEEIKAKKDKTIANLSEENESMARTLADVRTKCDELSAGHDSLASQHNLLSEEADSLRAEVSKLRADNNTLSSENESLKAENKSLLDAAFDASMPTDSAEVEELRSEVRRLTELINIASTEPRQRQKRGRKKKQTAENPAADLPAEPTTLEEATLPLIDDAPSGQAKISAIDELMDSTDWFKAPDPIPLKKDPVVEEEFGYKEPPKRPNLDSEKQLSLF